MKTKTQQIIATDYQYGFSDAEAPVFKTKKGIDEDVVRQISFQKNEPSWMLDLRLKAFHVFLKKPMPSWGADLSGIDFQNIYYYIKPSEMQERSWDDVPDTIKNTFDRLGIPQAERKFLAGVGAQYDSELVYHNLQGKLAKQGVLFSDVETAVKERPEFVKRYFGTVIPRTDNKFAALNSAVWSGGSFVYVPKGVKVDLPLQAYFRINAKNMGQFERTLIIADEGSFVHYVEGCTAPIYAASSLHSAVVEIIAHKGARVRYTTVQNWSHNVYNLVTKRAVAEEEAVVEWVDCNIGCLAGNSKIYVYQKGLKDMKDIEKGDEVYSLNLDNLLPCRKKVIAKINNGTRQMYKLICANDRQIEATDTHPFLALKKSLTGSSRHLEWIMLKNLEQGDYIALVHALPDDGKAYEINFSFEAIKPIKHKITAPAETSQELMWLLGAYAGDGYMETSKSTRPRRVYFAVPPDDKARQKLEAYLHKVLDIDFWRNKGICLTIGSTMLAQFMISLGFKGTAREKRVPQWVYTLPHEQKLAFIEGYLDTDGCERHSIEKNGVQYGQLTFASCNKKLLEDIKYLMISCGLNPLKISTYRADRKLYQGRIKEYITHYLTLNIRGNLDIIQDKRKIKPRVDFVKIKAIAPSRKEAVYDLEIEDTHNFIANGIVVHNSKITMKYPSVILKGRGARADILSMAFAGSAQHQDAGGKVIHLAEDTSSNIISKSVSQGGGRTSYRGLLRVADGAKRAKANVVCDALILDPASRSDTYPTIQIDEGDVSVGHEASVSKVGEEQLFYLKSRGLSEAQAKLLIINGFVEPIVKELPMEYAVEMNRLIALEMEGSVG